MGEDPLLGSEEHYELSEGLIRELHARVLYFLNQFVSQYETLSGSNIWKNVDELNIPVQYKDEWTNYIKMLNSNGIILTDNEDFLKWSWNTSNRTVTTKLAYEEITLN